MRQQTREIEERDFDKEWDRRAKIMAAALAVRDYKEADRAEVLSWAVPVLNAAANEKAKKVRRAPNRI